MFHRAQKGWTWRAIIASAAAYALALNLILAGALSGQVAIAGAASDGFEICLGHSGEADQQSPALPDTGKLHCVLCVVGTHAPVVPEGAIAIAAFAVSTIISVELAQSSSPSLAPRDPGKPPTGPPHAV
jgi:hypothetical protein